MQNADMNQFQVIVLALPIFFILISAEIIWGYVRQKRGTGHNTYGLSDTINSLSLGVLSQIGGIFSKLLTIGIYTSIYASVALFPDAELWRTWYGALLALVFYDLCYYWLHRISHTSALFWATHAVHHQSQHYNLSTALRQSSSGVFVAWIFYIPMAVAGVPPVLFGIVALVDLLYQFWVHTEQVGKLGWYDRVFCSPSNHRVHHAVNDHYLDKNYGGILILWDRLFGTFKEEDVKCIYGTRSQLNSWDPIWANASVFWSLLKASWHTKRWTDKVRYWLKPPGWHPEGMAQMDPAVVFDLALITRFDPPTSVAIRCLLALQFSLLLAGATAILWFADSMPMRNVAMWSAVLAVSYWTMGAVLQGRITLLMTLLINVAALATVTGELGLIELHLVCKPLTMVLAIMMVVRQSGVLQTKSSFYICLVGGLAASLAGDVFLMLPGNYFIAGLASFLVAHLFYITLLRQGVGWFPSRRALGVTLTLGAAMYAWLWSGLDGMVLKVAVGTYVGVLSLMTAQALGRATVMRDVASNAVAVGACVFMLSDALLAINRFVQPLPMVSLSVLASYYVAQILITHNARAPAPKAQARGFKSRTFRRLSGAV